MTELYPSLISSDLLNLQQTMNMLDAHCAGYHLDVMDFHFVSNLTWGPQFINAIRAGTEKKLWIHLMVDKPRLYLQRMNLKAGDCVTLHYESMPLDELIEALEIIADQKLCPGVALKPNTSVTTIVNVFNRTTVQPGHILLMSVEPGFSGQKFLENSYDRLAELVRIRTEHKFSFAIGMDGGINTNNIQLLKRMGCEQFAIASAIFNEKDPVQQLITLTSLIT